MTLASQFATLVLTGSGMIRIEFTGCITATVHEQTCRFNKTSADVEPDIPREEILDLLKRLNRLKVKVSSGDLIEQSTYYFVLTNALILLPE
jgi:CxxC motif-containing protein